MFVFSDISSNSKSTEGLFIHPTPSTNKMIPTFSKKKNTVKKRESTTTRTTKPKKFVPPIRNAPHKNEQENRVDIIQDISEGTSKDSFSKDDTSKRNIATEKTNTLTQALYNNDLNKQQSTQEWSQIQYDSNYNNDFLKLSTFPSNSDENPANFAAKIYHTEDAGNTEHRPIKKRSKKDPNIAGLIFGSLNVLNDDELLLSQNISQETYSDQSSVKELSRIQSLCSVTSLNKIYKNLDVKSFENAPNFESKSEVYKIPEGEEYLRLFKNVSTKNKCCKYTPMSIALGDMGFNKKYSDYMKEIGAVPEEMHCEEKDTFMKILEMYPKENEILIKMKYSK